jgi:ABC-2 type transport system ATP-binding protein
MARRTKGFEPPMNDDAPAIAVEGLTHTYKSGHTALNDVNLNCGTGLFGLLGPNGAGKSTLMRILCTLIPLETGSVRICGYDVNTQRQQVRENLGYLPQDFGAWKLHRVEEVLDTLAQFSGMHNKSIRRERVTEVLEQVGLGQVRDRKVKKLSGGMLRRLGVAQALVHEPRVIVVDEPTVGLDPEERIRFRRVMADLGRDRPILLSTHIVADLGAACREIALLDSGTICYQGAPAELVRHAEGKVFEVVADGQAAEDLEAEYDIVSTNVTGNEITLRGVSAGGLPDGATPVAEPSLEEAYMAFMAARGRSDAASQAEEHNPAPAERKRSKRG